MKKIFITGTNGFIGKNLVEGLSEIYNVYSPKRSELDLLNTLEVEKYLNQNKFDLIIHCATQNATRNKDISFYEILNRNLKMFFNLERCKDYYGKMYYFGSGAEYDMNSYIPKMKEEYFGVNIPNDPYGFSKYTMAKVTEGNNNIYDLRLFGVFGKYEEYERRFISNSICRTIFDLPITINQNVFFDYLFIGDLLEVMKWFIENEPKFKSYNVCTGISIDLLTIARKVLKVSNKELPILIKTPGYKNEYSGDNLRLLEEIGDFKFKPIDESINLLYEYYLDNKNYIDIDKVLLS